jgi:hypothetical protein
MPTRRPLAHGHLVNLGFRSRSAYIRPETYETYQRIDVDAAIRFIDPVPEPATGLLIGAVALLLTRRLRRRQTP